MTRPTRITLLSVTLALLLLPLVLHKPGLPLFLRAGEATSYMAAMSLARDQNLTCEPADLRRLFDDFSVGSGHLLLRSTDGFRTATIGTDIVYPVLAAPAAALFGANGVTAFNMAALLLAVWLAADYLRRWNEDGHSALFAFGFFVLSPGLFYALWLGDEAFLMAIAAAALYLAFRQPDNERWSDWRLILGGALLALGSYQRPLLIVLAVPILHQLWRVAGRRMAFWLGAAGITLAAIATTAWALTGHPYPAAGGETREVAVRAPVEDLRELPQAESSMPTAARLVETATAAAGDIDAKRIAFDLAYFLCGRYTGLVPHLPFALLALGLFALASKRSPSQRLLVATVAVAALATVVFLPEQWAGGRDAVGNRYLLSLSPALLFAVTHLRPVVTVLGYALAGLLLGPLLFTPFGAAVPPDADLHAHTRNLPNRIFPVERTLVASLRDHPAIVRGDTTFRIREDLAVPSHDEIWLHGALPIELWMEADGPPFDRVFVVRNITPGNEILLDDGDQVHRLQFQDGTGDQRRVIASAKDCTSFAGERHVCRLWLRAQAGSWPAWRDSSNVTWYLGAALTYVGPEKLLDREVFAAEWLDCTVPTALAPGDEAVLTTRLANRSGEVWPSQGAARIQLAYRWLDATGNPVPHDGVRTGLERDVAPGADVTVAQTVIAPPAAGSYRLVRDLVFENVAWFSERGVATCEALVTVSPEHPPAPQ